MPIDEIDIYRSANTWLQLHGAEAIAKAEEMIAQMAAKGDAGGVAAWRRIMAAIQEMKGLPAGEGRRLQ